MENYIKKIWNDPSLQFIDTNKVKEFIKFYARSDNTLCGKVSR